MIPHAYLHGLNPDEPELPGVYGVPHARIPGSWRILSSYADGKRHKSKLFAAMKAMGQVEKARTWEWHHVVEGQHYADIDFSGRLDELYMKALPCILISKEEHTAYNRLLHIRETDELYRDASLPADLRQRSVAAAAAARNRANHVQLRAQVAQLRQLYHDAYDGDRVLMTIADNVLDEALTHLH